MPPIRADGAKLRAGDRRFTAFGFNYWGGSEPDRLYSFAGNRDEALEHYLTGMEKARDLGANTLRVYLPLFDFIHRHRGEVRVRRLALASLREVLAAAERLGIYLDLTGNVVWVPDSAPLWYDALSAGRRWDVQAHFWRAVARTAARSPAVLCYELTSEPGLAISSGAWYAGRFGGYDFMQYVRKDAALRDQAALARRWTRKLASAIRGHDRDHLIGIGLMPFAEGPFGAANLQDLLDVLIVHIYPRTGQAAASVRIAKAFARHGKPVILGETAMLYCDAATQRRFLVDASPHLQGFLTFLPHRVTRRSPRDAAEALRRTNLAEFRTLRARLLGTD
jgi:hypothetical protein